MLKNKLYQYFGKEFLKNFFLVLISLSLIMLLAQAARFLDIITEMGNSSMTYFKFTILNYPKFVEKVLPLSFMISIFFTISKLKTNKELNVFLYSGISQSRLFKILFQITIFIFIFYFILSVFLGPYSSSLSRKILAKSDFTLINSLVKEKNFNSPLKALTIYVEENDKKGNLKKIFINENDRTISAKYAKVLRDGNIVFLELYDGISLERTGNSSNSITFEKLNFNFSKYKTKNLKVEKFSERKIFWLFKELKNETSKKKDLIYEINKRLIKPFFIFVIVIFSSYIIYIKDDEQKKINFNYLLFFSSFIFLILNEIMLGFSSGGVIHSIIYLLSIFIISIIFLMKHLKKN